MSISTRQKQRIWLIIAFIVVSYFASKYSPEHMFSQSSQPISIEKLFQQKQSNVQLEVTGNVIKLLRDDVNGSRHQRFIIKLASGHTLLIAHNIDLAHRVDALYLGDEITAYGEYEWNSEGGVLHWTHHDPENNHPHGWIRHHGLQYQ